MKINHKFDTAFRRKAREIKAKPSAHVWNRIDENLSRRKRNSVYSIIGIAASFVIIFMCILMLDQSKKIYQNPNYQVEQMDTEGQNDYNVALMKWVSFNRNS